jgi:DNA-binding MarR family transcriptional regulator
MAARSALPLDGHGCEALVLVAHNPSRSLDWLRRRLALTHSGAVRLADRLQREGLLARSRSGREVTLVLTPAGDAAVRRVLAARREALDALVAPLASDDRDHLVRLMDAMLAAPRRSRAEADRGCRWCDWPACGPDCPIDRTARPE